ncbi:MAG: tetraacyldisaccharide 4'-kinase, partial [Pseudomonadales bacterium]
ASEVGDEPIMIRNRTGCPVVVAPDRVSAAKMLLDRHDCDLIISDDGLQHYALDRDLEIAMIDGERGLGNGLCLPAGPLREPVSRLDEVDLVIVNGGSAPLQLDIKAPVETMQLVPSRFVNITTGATQGTDFFAGKQVHAVAGIGNPQRFFISLAALGCELASRYPFPDHYAFNAQDLAFDDDLPIIMTEKDAVRLSSTGALPADTDLWYLEVVAELPLEQLALLSEKMLFQKIKKG